MKIPNLKNAENMLLEAEKMNPGAWVAHNKVAAMCAKSIAAKTPDLDEDISYTLGLLHDIGRRDGVMDMKHILCGYRFMTSQGFDDSAKICLTHSFPYKNIGSYNGQNDCSDEETKFIQDYINNVEYSDYDKLIQLCDALAFPNCATYLEKRLVDVVMRRGFNEFTVIKWKAFFELKHYFDLKTGTDIYKLFQL